MSFGLFLWLSGIVASCDHFATILLSEYFVYRLQIHMFVSDVLIIRMPTFKVTYHNYIEPTYDKQRLQNLSVDNIVNCRSQLSHISSTSECMNCHRAKLAKFNVTWRRWLLNTICQVLLYIELVLFKIYYIQFIKKKSWFCNIDQTQDYRFLIFFVIAWICKQLSKLK